jgi:hypothetical protein
MIFEWKFLWQAYPKLNHHFLTLPFDQTLEWSYNTGEWQKIDYTETHSHKFDQVTLAFLTMEINIAYLHLDDT